MHDMELFSTCLPHFSVVNGHVNVLVVSGYFLVFMSVHICTYIS
jgi:hypothetical protein